MEAVQTAEPLRNPPTFESVWANTLITYINLTC
jgi:hypothetical protein